MESGIISQGLPFISSEYLRHLKCLSVHLLTECNLRVLIWIKTPFRELSPDSVF